MKLALIATIVLCVQVAVLSEAPAQTSSPATKASQCVTNPGAIDAVAGATPLSAGTSIVANTTGAKTLTLTLPSTYRTLRAESGDIARSSLLPSGDTQVTWTLGDPTKPYRYLNAVSASGAVRVLSAVNLRGLPACVETTAGNDTLVLKLPDNLGTTRLAISSDGTSIVASAGSETDVLQLDGRLSTTALSGSMRLTGRWSGTPVDLGTVSFTANGLQTSTTSSLPAVDIPTAAGNVTISGVSLRMTPGAASVTASFAPQLPPALPFSLGTVTANLVRDAGGALSLHCAGDVPVAVTTPLAGAPPNVMLRLGSDGNPTIVKCGSGGTYDEIVGTLAVTWPKLVDVDSVTTVFRFDASNGAVRFAVKDGSLPQSLQFDALGVDARIDGAHLMGDGSSLQLEGDVSLSLRHLPALASVRSRLVLAVRSAPGAQPVAALSCAGATVPPKSATGTIAFAPHCDGTEIDGITTAGGNFPLPDAAGGGTVPLPAFTVARGKLQLDPSSSSSCMPTPKNATTPNRFMEFGAFTLRGCTFSYDAGSGLALTVQGSLALPSYLVTKGTELNVTRAVIGYRAKTTHAYGLTSVDANMTPPDGQAIHFLGMELLSVHNGDANSACHDGFMVRAHTVTEEELGGPLQVTLCAEARLPEYLAFESKPRIGLLKDGVIQSRPTRPAILTFEGLTFTRDGIVPPTDGDLTSKSDCKQKHTGVDTKAKRIFDCRVYGGYAIASEDAEGTEKAVTLGPLSLSNIRLNLVAKAVDANDVLHDVPAAEPQFHFTSDVAFAKYLSSDGPSGSLSADFNHKHMVMIGDFDKPVTVRAGVVSVGLQSFEMDLDDSQRRFVAGGVSVATESTGGVNSTALYFKQIAFLETNEGSGWHLKKLAAPLDIPKTALGLAYRLFSDLSATSFLHLFRLP